MNQIETRRIFRLNTLLLATTMIVAIVPPASAQRADTIELEQINVEGERTGDLKEGQTKADPARTEGTKSYTTDKATVGGKGAIPLRQIPQSISVVTRERIKDQNFTQLEDAARRSPGLLVLRNDPGRSSIFSRGFEFDQFSVDGLPAPMSSIHGTQPDLAIFDRIEILRGPAALYSGNGEPGGSVNLARKRATFDPEFSASGSIGSWNNFRTELDASGALNEAKTVRGRIAGAFQDRESFVDVNENQVWVGYGTLEFDITDNTTLSIAAWHQERQSVPFNGLAAFSNGTDIWLPDVPRSTFTGADWNTFDNATTDVLAELEHRLDNGGHIKAGIRYSDREADMLYGYNQGVYDPATGNAAAVGLLAREYEGESLSGDVHLSTPFEAWGLEHNFLIGVDFRDYSETMRSNAGPVTWPGGAPPVNVYDSDPNWPMPSFNFGPWQTTDTQQAGIYSQLRVKPVEPFTIVLGGRIGHFEGESVGTSYDETKFVPYAAAIVDLTDQISIYASYAETFQQQTALLPPASGGGLIGPREGVQYEAGVKGSFYGGALNASLAAFYLEDANRAIAQGGSGFALPADVEVSGFEAEISGTIEGWDVYASYSYAVNEYTKHPAGADVFLSYWPEHSFNLWTKYTFQNPKLEGWHIAGGLKAVSSFRQEGALGGVPYVLEEDGYITVDGQIGYQINENLSAALTVTNIFDEKYYERIGSPVVFNFYGEPRAVNLTMRANF